MNSIKIAYNGFFVGVCEYDKKNEKTFFQYRPDFLKTGISLSPLLLPLENKVFEFDSKTYNPQTFKSLPPMLADSLPDDFGNKMFAQWLMSNNISQNDLNPLEKLCYVGKRGIGALEYEPAIETKKTQSNINISDLLEVANAVYFKKENETLALNDYHKSLSSILRIGSSVGGARAKALIAINEKTKKIKAGDVLHKGDYKYYLIKFDGVKNGRIIEPVGYGVLEYVYYKMASDAGIAMSECKLLKENGRAHFLTERFDRNNGKKIHVQTLCAMTGVDFRKPNLIGYEDIFRFLNFLKADYSEKLQLFRRMIFNVLAFNRDDHTKNFSFIYTDGTWRLSPAYDLTFAYDPSNFWLKQHNINVNGKNSRISKKDILSVGEQFGVKKAELIFSQVKEAVARFSDYAVKYNLNDDMRIAVKNVLNDKAVL